MEPLFGLGEDVINKINSIFLKYPKIEQAIIFGSRAKGNFRPGSDIDLVLISPNGTLSDQLEIENQLDDLLLPYKIDLSLMHQIDNPDLLDHIRRLGKTFYRKIVTGQPSTDAS